MREMLSSMEQSGASAPDEAVLLAGWVGSQDEASLSALIELHRPMVTGVCRRILRRAGDAEDAVQETFIALAGKAATIEGSIGGWLRVVAARNAVAQLRALQRQRFQDRQADPVAPVPGEVPTDIVDACLAELTVAERDLIVRLFYLGETQADIARLDRSSRLQIHRRLQQALERLRTLARRRGLRIAPAALLLLLSGGDEATAAEATRRPQMATAPLVGVAAVGLLLAGIWLAAGGDAPAPVATAAGPVAVEAPPASGIPPAASPARPEPACEVVRELSWMPGQRIAGAWRDRDDAADPVAGVAFKELEVAAVPNMTLRDNVGSNQDPMTPTFTPLVGSPHLKPVLLRWHDGRESIGLRCSPPFESVLMIRPQNQGFDGFLASGRTEGDGVQGWEHIRFRRRIEGGEMLTEIINQTEGAGPPLRTWTRSPWPKPRPRMTYPIYAIYQPRTLVALHFEWTSAEESLAMDARCPGQASIAPVPMDPAPPVW
jgi:RNA polymerase sigma factor (sigma-70 family)